TICMRRCRLPRLVSDGRGSGSRLGLPPCSSATCIACRFRSVRRRSIFFHRDEHRAGRRPRLALAPNELPPPDAHVHRNDASTHARWVSPPRHRFVGVVDLPAIGSETTLVDVAAMIAALPPAIVHVSFAATRWFTPTPDDLEALGRVSKRTIAGAEIA